MFSVFRRPFGGPNAVIYSYELSKEFLDKGTTSILEVGCGIGMFCMRYAPLHPSVFVEGVDHSAKTIDFLSSKYGRYYKNLKLTVCDFCDPDLHLGRDFDTVYTSDVIEHVTDIHAFVGNIHRHLRTGGKTVVNFPNIVSHGINHFAEVRDICNLFAQFTQTEVFVVDIHHPVEALWNKTKAVYERLFAPSITKERNRLYAAEAQGIDCFEESTCFQFVHDKGTFAPMAASVLAEIFLAVKPTFNIRQVKEGVILNSLRIVVVATK